MLGRVVGARVFLCWLALIAATSTEAEAIPAGLYCGNKLITQGDPGYRVLKLCGEPDARARRVEYRTVKRKVRGPCPAPRSVEPEAIEPKTIEAAPGWRPSEGLPTADCSRIEEVTIEVALDEWTYDFGQNRLVHYLLFEEDRLIDVRLGGYGIKDSAP